MNKNIFTKSSDMLRILFNFLFITFSLSILCLGIYDLILGFTGNCPTGYSWGKYSPQKRVMFLAITIALFSFILYFVFVKSITCKQISKMRKWIVYPFLLLLITLILRSLFILCIGIETTYNSDIGLAISQAYGSPPFSEGSTAAVSSWAVFPLYLKIINAFFGSIEFPAILMNNVWTGLSSILIYYIIIYRTGDVRWGIFSSLLFSTWPAHLFFSTAIRPEYISITLILFLVFILSIAEKAYNSGEKKRYLICLLTSGVVLGISKFFKDLTIIIFISIFIIIILKIMKKDIENRSIKCIFIYMKHISRLIRSNFGTFMLGFLLMICSYSITTNGVYALLNRFYTHEINKNYIAHYLYIGLTPWSDGSNHPDEKTHSLEVYRNYVRKTNYNYKEATRLTLEQLKKEISQESNLTFGFFWNKLRISWSNQAYLIWPDIEMRNNNNVLNKHIWIKILYPVIQTWYVLFLLFMYIGSVYNLFNKDKNIMLFSCLMIFGFACLLLLSETQPRYKTTVYPFMAIIAASGMEKSIQIFESIIRKIENGRREKRLGVK